MIETGGRVPAAGIGTKEPMGAGRSGATQLLAAISRLPMAEGVDMDTKEGEQLQRGGHSGKSDRT
jgi:hypothetical protein